MRAEWRAERRRKAAGVLGCALAMTVALLAGCDAPVRVSDTGYVGTWTRGNDRVSSTIAIYHDGERYRFRWFVHSKDGKWSVRCDWDGQCEEFVDGEKTSVYTFRTWTEETTGHLMVECTGRVWKPREVEIHYVDELVLADEGRTLWSYTLERGGQRFEGDARPRRQFRKVSDAVANPPRRLPRPEAAS